MYHVSRQQYYYSRVSAVEVTRGGIQHASPDMLVEKYRYLGEGQEYLDPRFAVEAAIRIVKAWNKDHPHAKAKLAVGVGAGLVGLEPEPGTFKAAREWAQREWENLPRCARCGDLLSPKSTFTSELTDEEEFCSEYCVGEAISEGYDQAV